MMMKAVALLGLLGTSIAFAPVPSVIRQSVATNAITSQWSMDDPAPEVGKIAYPPRVQNSPSLTSLATLVSFQHQLLP